MQPSISLCHFLGGIEKVSGNLPLIKSRYMIPTVFPDEPDLGALYKRICGFHLNCLCHILLAKIFPFKRDSLIPCFD